MALDLFKNFAKVQVSIGYDASATSIVLSSGHGARLPAAPFNATYWNDTDFPDPSDDPNVEIVRVTAKSTDTLTITRAQESTTASTKNTSGKTYKMIAGLTAKTFNTDLGAAMAQVGNGRLTLATGEPVVVATDVVGASTIYFTPFKGNIISLYDGTSWAAHTFSEVGLPLGTLTSDKNYDVFLYNNGGMLTLELGAAWADNSTRTDNITFQDGVYVKSGAPTRRYLGTFRTTSTTTTEDSQTKRLLWNVENQIFKRAYKTMLASHSYTGGWRIYAGDATNKLDIVVGLVSVVNISFSCGITPTAGAVYAGVGINTTAGVTAEFAFGHAVVGNLIQDTSGMPWGLTLGYSEVNMLEYAPAGASMASASLSATLFN